MKQIDPDALRSPTNEAVLEGLVRSIEAGGIDPAPARLEDMDDSADHAAIIDPRLPSRTGGPMVRDLLELLVREPEAISIHQWPPDEVVNHESAARSNSFMGPGPRARVGTN
jgi:hypothetical protein